MTDHIKNRILSSILVDSNGCWIWQKATAKNGYGSFALGGGRTARAHRISFEVFNGDIPAGLDVCHSCDVRPCVNPHHLWLGTRSENILDASRKNRVSRTHHKRGTEHPGAKLDDAKVSAVLQQLYSGQSKASLSREFGVSQRVILLIARGEAWAHVPRRNVA